MSGGVADRFRQTLAEAIQRLDGAPELAGLRTTLAERAGLLDARMRVAVVGRICQGKSTLVNALLGKRLTPTGTLELSYSINHIRYGSPPTMTVHFKDGTSTSASLEELEKYAARRDDNRELLSSVKFLDVVSDQPYLVGFDLIDTAGLDSIWGEDSEGTLEFLQRSRAEVRAETVEASTEADALLVVMSHRGMAESDQEMLRTFLGPESAFRSPVTTTAVMTKVEDLWPANDSPFEAARQIISTMLTKPGVREVLFEIQPVCGRLAESAATLDESDLCDFKTLAGLPVGQLETALRGADMFCRPDRGLPLAPGRRKQLYDRYTGYGLLIATRLLRDGVDSVTELRELLDRHSGLEELRTRLTNHFTHRADLLKIRITAELLHQADHRLRRHLSDPDKHRLDASAALIGAFVGEELGPRELDLLQRVVTGATKPGERDLDDLLNAIGEHGRAAHQRLGLPNTASLTELRDRAVELSDRWRLRTELGDRHTARVLHDRYQNLIQHIDAARHHLENP
ncbi:Dynamin family protein [Streptomyces sp. OV198]|uniref:dynamin family protein n=1 Tax=Streptomyces sp. OV198 TaxID=1882787 RepID=UPI000BC8DBE9|nr:dynamin family protein [Streptomyces sp. OV198]SOF02868.1 Dynamin family protein [Streptomyces sp. OV198]